MNKDTFIQDWLEGNISPEQMEQLKGDPEYQEVIAELDHILSATSKLEAPKTKSKSQVWDELSSQLEEGSDKSKSTKVVTFRPYIAVGIAAAISLLLVVYFLLPSSNVFSTQVGEQLSHVFPDGSTAQLNAETNISYNKSNWEKSRIVELDGEAFFDVKPGNTFTIKTTYGSIEVLGTSFNAFARKGKLEVACFEGSVKVRSTQDEEVVLKKGEYTATENGAIKTPDQFETSKTATWRTGEFYFEDTPLQDVVAELQRQFNITINLELTEQRHYTGYFNNNDLEEALQLVFTPMSLEYSREGSTIEVK